MGTTISSQSKSLGVLAITNADKDLYEVNGRTLVSARLGVDAPDGRWAVFGWGRNIFNKYYWTNTIQTDRKSVVSGKSGSVRVDLGGRGVLKTNKTQQDKKELQNNVKSK